GQAVACRREESAVRGIGIGAAHQLDLHDVMGGNHARVGRMELIVEAKLAKLPADGVDAIGDDQNWPVVMLGDEIAQQPADGTGHADTLAALPYQRELAVDGGNAVAARDEGASLLYLHVVNTIAGWVGEIDDPRQGDGPVHGVAL